jgi:hypothetical protein
VHATAGNISVALDDGVLITPTDACLGRCSLVRWPGSTRRVHSSTAGCRASKTLACICRIYDADTLPLQSCTRTARTSSR